MIYVTFFSLVSSRNNRNYMEFNLLHFFFPFCSALAVMVNWSYITANLRHGDEVQRKLLLTR